MKIIEVQFPRSKIVLSEDAGTFLVIENEDETAVNRQYEDTADSGSDEGIAVSASSINEALLALGFPQVNIDRATITAGG